MNFLQENYQIVNSDPKLDSPLTEGNVRCQHWPQRQSPEVYIHEQSATRGHMQETEKTALHSH